MWDVAGYFYGRHIYTLARFSPIKSRRRRATHRLRRHAIGKLTSSDTVELAG